ncbi:pentapeptide repeat-containing protein [Nitratireductor sp. CAU 1489]|uniref:Pentapeptide repeat-containing protein n=1 Tax=Nitratireductor arenosus TaxID=2682096 RepID=A0A844QG95_9HYPH|nr:pentapeptide repeat-containing protein [Nitratireductor arenosus]MVA98127.1 pentapeptide repeat-containing protein [Nitratireductor arenosus]
MTSRTRAHRPTRSKERLNRAGAWPTRLAGFIIVLLLATGAAQAADCRSAPAPGIDWRDCNKSNLILKDADLEGAALVDTDFSETDLRGARLVSANLEKATLLRASLAGASAEKANFGKVEAYRSDLSGLSAENASFASAELQRSRFNNARLAGADFQKAELGRAEFSGSALANNSFALANLSRADFRGATMEGPVDFAGAFLFLTRFEGVDLGAATGLRQEQIDIACGDAATLLPDGLMTPRDWPCAFE